MVRDKLGVFSRWDQAWGRYFPSVQEDPKFQTVVILSLIHNDQYLHSLSYKMTCCPWQFVYWAQGVQLQKIVGSQMNSLLFTSLEKLTCKWFLDYLWSCLKLSNMGFRTHAVLPCDHIFFIIGCPFQCKWCELRDEGSKSREFLFLFAHFRDMTGTLLLWIIPDKIRELFYEWNSCRLPEFCLDSVLHAGQVTLSTLSQETCLFIFIYLCLASTEWTLRNRAVLFEQNTVL